MHGLEEIGEQPRVAAHLGFREPFAEPIQPGSAVAREHVERIVAAEIGRESHAEARLIRPARFSRGMTSKARRPGSSTMR